ncbi:MAG: UDP-N-acetylenolpyruvoylglucosamine reductase, partial [Actinomycetota bacterium]|nr:UDP-N-acetylenolpyruvoylglucosamine reductase [Actinomycetota bacterium]
SFFTNPIIDPEEAAMLEQRAQELYGPDVSPPAYPAEDGMVKTSAAWLIERSGFTRGFGDGDVGLSRNHTLAIVNRGGATTAELVEFARGISFGVESVFGIPLTPEPVFVGHSW